MSFSPSINMVRLQELKLWQGSYDNLIQNAKTASKHPENEGLEGVSLLDNTNSTTISHDRDKKRYRDWDKVEIVGAKPFEQLLEEKLTQETPIVTAAKPKKPFLRKGQGLARYRMGTNHSVNNKKYSMPKENKSNVQKYSPQDRLTPKKGILKKSVPHYHEYVDLSPLTVPDFVKPRGVWKSAVDDEEKLDRREKPFHSERQEEAENYEEFRRSLGREKTSVDAPENPKATDGRKSDRVSTDVEEDGGKMPSSSKPDFEQFNKEILEKISDYAHKYFPSTRTFLSNDIPKSISEISTPNFKSHIEDLSMHEQKMEKELRIFEALERKVENSSFCSTNTSVVDLLASTPQKIDIIKGNEAPKQKAPTVYDYPVEESIEFTNDRHENVQFKLAEVAEKTDILQQFLMNLRKMDHAAIQQEISSLQSDTTKRSASTNTSYSEENARWSSRSPSVTDNYTEFDTTCQSDNWKKIDIGTNTSFDGSRLEETLKNREQCKECEELRWKLEQSKGELGDLQSENSSVKAHLKVLENQLKEVERESRRRREEARETIDRLSEELDREKKKFAKEKSYFEMYVREAQTRPSKKEREEVTQLKQELVDAKELLKLKDAKNGATQARLRTQIKQQEKEMNELKTTVEKLQKENAKLHANQKLARRPQEVKMLHEINKNLSKLTEEAFKKQTAKSGNGDAAQNGVREGTLSTNMEDDGGNKENDRFRSNVTDKEAKISVPALSRSKDSFRTDSVGLDLTNSEGLTIEKQYENVFGNFNSPRNSNASTNLEKCEKTLSDGSMEINYSNGNVKTISADGQLVTIKYFNGDVKETNLKEKIIRYRYAANDSWHIQYPDGLEVMEYADGQKCTKQTDGRMEISYPDGSLRTINPDGTEEHQFPDGRKTVKNLRGEQIIMLPNGQREIHSKDFKRREYPNGTVRTLHKDGSVETVYANGRVRLKDANGVLIMDSHQTPISLIRP